MTSAEERRAVVERLQPDLPLFAKLCLKIRDKEQRLRPLVFNDPQTILHEAAEKQLRETGKIRLIVVKSRRTGASTYIASRGYHKSSLNSGVSVSIVAHISQSTNALYRIVKRFHENNDPLVTPELRQSNVKGLEFDGMDSRYTVYSGETDNIGRGDEISFLHLSEAGMMGNLEAHMAGIVNCVSDAPRTEVWIESTAKGPSGPFYDMCQDALAGRGDFRLVFIPWTMDSDCYREPPPDFAPRIERDHEDFPSESELIEMHGLSAGQIYWRRLKMGSPKRIHAFAHEYPLTLQDAFSAAVVGGLIGPIDVQRARKAKKLPIGPVIIGVDPASATGGDRFAIACRQGNVVKWVRSRTGIKVAEGLEWVRSVIEEEKPDRVHIDAAGAGSGDAIISVLRNDPQYANIVYGVNFGSVSQSKMRRPDAPGPKNRRAEMWKRLADALESPEGMQIPDDDALASDLCSVTVDLSGLEGDWILPPKHKAKRSPDLGDAVALTFADDYVTPLHPERRHGKRSDGGGLFARRKLPPKSLGWMA